MDGIIYCITSTVTNKKYVGQTTNKKNNINNSLKYRLNYHIASALKTKRNTRINEEIRKHGKENFKIELLEKCNTKELDKKECEWIEKLDTYNNGLNKQKYSRCRTLKLPINYKVDKIEIRGIKKDDELSKIRVIVNNKKRYMYNSKNNNFYTLLKNVINICKEYSNNIILDISLLNNLNDNEIDLYNDYKRIKCLFNKKIQKIRIVLQRNYLIRMYIRTDDMINWKDEKTITFGGKHIDIKNSYQRCMNILEILKENNDNILIENSLKDIGVKKVSASQLSDILERVNSQITLLM